MKNVINKEKEKEKELLIDIVMFNNLVADIRILHSYRSAQLENNIKDDTETHELYRQKIGELDSMMSLQKSNIEIKYNIILDEEVCYFGIIPELYLKKEITYVLTDENCKNIKVKKIIEQLKMI